MTRQLARKSSSNGRLPPGMPMILSASIIRHATGVIPYIPTEQASTVTLLLEKMDVKGTRTRSSLSTPQMLGTCKLALISRANTP